MMSLKKPSYSWWFDSHNSPRSSPWLQSTLSELDEKTKAMLKLIEEDADSFAQRAEMYYKKRPQLIYMVEDFYRAHRSLAERYDQLKLEAASARPLGSPFSRKNSSHRSCIAFSDSFDSEESEVDDPDHEEAQVYRNIGEKVTGEDSNTCRSLADIYNQLKLESSTRLMKMPSGSSFSGKNSSRNFRHLSDKSSIASSDSFDSEMSEVEDPEQEETQVDKDIGKEITSKDRSDNELMKLKEEPEKLKEENRIEKAELMQKQETDVYEDMAEEVSSEERSHNEGMKLKEEPERLKEENRIEKAELVQKQETDVYKDMTEEVSSEDRSHNEGMKLKAELERLKEENRIQKAELMEKNEEKREAIRQLCMSMDMLREENAWLKKCLQDSKKRSTFEFSKLKGAFSGKFFSWHPKFQPTLVAL